MASEAPTEIQAIAAARADARARHDWAKADLLRGELEAAGWKVIDSGVDFRLEPAHPPDVVEDGRVRYGSSASVPSRLTEPSTGAATVVLRATDWPDDVDRALAGLRAHAPGGTQVVIVADDTSEAQSSALEALEPIAGLEPELVWTSKRLGQAAALNAGIRRAAAPIVVVMDTSVEPTGDIVTPLIGVLDDPTVAVTGAYGVDSADLRRFDEAPAGDVDAVEGYVLAFRRGDFTDRGPLDERFRFYRNLDLWWSLALRDGGEDGDARRAVTTDLPLERHEHRGWDEVGEPERQRLSKRNFYRIIDRFGHRYDLLKAPAPSRR